MVEVPVSNGRGVARVDDEDAVRVGAYRWHLLPKGYAAATVRGKTVFMHRFIIGAPKGLQVDHADHDKLNNTRANLRLCTVGQNAQHNRRRSRHGVMTSRYRGVLRNKGRWFVFVGPRGAVVRLGPFDAEEDAARAYDERARALYGEFANLNFPERG